MPDTTVDEAWKALNRETGWSKADTIARHRPAIEAAIRAEYEARIERLQQTLALHLRADSVTMTTEYYENERGEWVERGRAESAQELAALREALTDMTGAYHQERKHAGKWDACQHPRCQNARLAMEGRGPFAIEAAIRAEELDMERLADWLCQAQEAGQHLDQVSPTTAEHWRGVASRAAEYARLADAER